MERVKLFAFSNLENPAVNKLTSRNVAKRKLKNTKMLTTTLQLA